jgi:AcrR family transcriptional regulator
MKADSRTRLLQAAEKTTYLYGFGSTSIADIAKEAGVPLGNVYYYFKTKDDIGGGIVEPRVSRFKKLLQELDSVNSPKEPLCGFVDIKIKNREAPARGGCLVVLRTAKIWRHNSKEIEGIVLRKPWPGWRRNSGCLAKGPIPEASLCISYPQRKGYPYSLTPFRIQT